MKVKRAVQIRSNELSFISHRGCIMIKCLNMQPRNQSVGELVVLKTTNSSTLWSSSNYSIVNRPFCYEIPDGQCGPEVSFGIFFIILLIICIIRRSIHVLRSNLNVQRKCISGCLCRVLTCMHVFGVFFNDRIILWLSPFCIITNAI